MTIMMKKGEKKQFGLLITIIFNKDWAQYANYINFKQKQDEEKNTNQLLNFPLTVRKKANKRERETKQQLKMSLITNY